MEHLVLVGLVFSVLFITNVQGTYKLCAFPSMDSIACDRVEEGNSNVSCIRVTDSVVCSDMIKNGLADFALYNADEAVLAGKFVRDFVNVIGESRDKKRYTEQNFEDLVVVVRKPFSGSFADLRGLGYCHPGVGISHKISDKILKSFEQSVVPKGPSCNNLYSIAEQELRDLESFFGPSCRPGRWARDDDLENKLKKTYRNMCQLCDSPTQCSNSQLSSGLEREALDCLVGQDGRQGGDVAFVSLAAVDSYFGLSTKSASASFAEYLFLCPNQTVMPINTSTKPCIWASQPWDLLITRKAVSGELQDKLNVWLSDVKKEGSERWQHHLRKLLLKDSGVFISKSYNSSLPIHQYINRGVAERDNRHCKRSVEWCTTEEAEWEKCKWLQGATETFGIEPHMQCSTRAEDKWKCMQKIAEGTADLLSIPTDDGFLARTVFNLSTLFFEDNVINANYRIIAVVKNQNGVANGFKGLKNRKACFPEYKGLAWNGFVSTVKEQGLLGRQCPEYYFSETCAPGALSNEFNPSRRRTLPQLCSLCPANDAGFNCSPHFPRRNRTLRALQCLDNNGDVAFINLRAVLSGDRVPQLDPSIDPTKYKILCSNGSTVEFSLNVDDSCALSVGVHGEVMARNNRNYVQDTDAKELLLQLNRWFGTSEDDVRNTISLFGKYKGTSGLMFEERTISLVDSDDNNYDYISSYKALLDSVSKVCTGGATSLNSFGSLGLLLTTLTAMAFYM